MQKNNNIIINSFFYLFFVCTGILTILYQIHFDDLWFDEMVSFWVADPSLIHSETLLRHNEIDLHSPKLFTFLLKFFLNFTGYDSQLARYLPFIFGSVSLIIFGAISYQVQKNSSFLLTTFLACTSIYIIKYSQELRPYSLLLLTSSLNIFFYINLIFNSEKKIKNSLFFIFFSVLNYSTHPFALIIFFSQITHSIYKYIFLNEALKMHLFLYLLVIVFYTIFNHNYILLQISFESYSLSDDIKNVIDGFYFPRFFGSKIMGYYYLLLLILLVIKNSKMIFSKKNIYLFLLIIILFSYVVPLVYGIINTPVLHDRYIIFILIPILVLISCLIYEIKNKKVKFILISFTVILTLLNHYIEVFERPNTKPQFNNIIEDIHLSDTKNIVLFINDDPSDDVYKNLISNYIQNIVSSPKYIFKFYRYDNMPDELQNLWLICYKPNIDYDCKIKTNNNFEIVDTKIYWQVEAKLHKLK